ncbi:hypothetical protein C4552_00065 [Candidatus Parcubacteria bacterium]|nr:MAG: hypothetical protein C4552_00065 [Candidatus Parcubacteria bacterium]
MEIIGHERPLAYLRAVATRGELAHAYLFVGPAGVGKRAVAEALARELLCSAKRHDFGGCGACADCALMANRAHPDVVTLSPAERLLTDADKKDIGIEDVHELTRRLAATAWRGGWRVAIVDGVERMSRDAMTALLKTLEEPGERTVFVLIAQTLSGILPTIRSRAVPLAFTPVADDELAPMLASLPAGERAPALALANGRPGIAVRLANDAEFRERALSEQREYHTLLRAALPTQFSFAEAESREPGRLEGFLSYAAAELRKDLAAAVGERQQRIAAALGIMLKTLASLAGANVNRRLAADHLFFQLDGLRRQTV